jgi:uncharacterized protein YaeQ
MAQTATIYTFDIELSDVDRGVYATLNLRVAKQPSESLPFLLTRVLAYCLEYEEGIAFSPGIAAGDEPALLVRDLTGRIVVWIEVGAPDGERLHRGSKSAERVAVYSHHPLGKLKQQLAGAQVHRAEAISVHFLDRVFLSALVQATERRTTMSLLITEQQLFVEVAGTSLTGTLETYSLNELTSR